MRSILCLPLALLLVACDEKPKTQAVLEENKDTIAAAIDSTDSVANMKHYVDSNSGHYAECETWLANLQEWRANHQGEIEGILRPSSYRIYCGEDPTKAINKDWVSFYRDSAENYYIKQADYYIEDGYDECAEAKTKILGSKDDVILFMNMPNIKKGKIDHVNLLQAAVRPNDTLRFEFNGVSYHFRATGNIAEYENVENYKLYIGTNEKPEELLLEIEHFHYTFMSILFIGDIDGDGIPDFMFNTSTDYEEENIELFLSTKAEKGKITKKVANFNEQHDC